MGEVSDYSKVIQATASNYMDIERSIASQLSLEVPKHNLTCGLFRETVWKSLFDMIVPKKYCIEQGVFIIDSYGNVSREVDLAIFDELYTPYIFNFGKIKFIPIEAVAAVVQCKSKNVESSNKDENKGISEWVKSIDNLITSLDSVARLSTNMCDNADKDIKHKSTQTATRPIKILCAMVEESKLIKQKENFDIMLSINEKGDGLFKIIEGESRSLEEWNEQLNHATGNISEDEDKHFRKCKKLGEYPKEKNGEVQDEEKNEEAQDEEKSTNRAEFLKNLKVLNADGSENVILSLIFQFNQLLMVLNNPMLFPHHAYAAKFDEILKDIKIQEGEKENGKKK